MKKIKYLVISYISIFILFPLIRLINKKFYDTNILPQVINSSCNSKPIDYQRKKIIPQAKGVVLEIGIGPGSNLKHYQQNKVEKIIGVDPSTELNKIAIKRAEKYNLDIEFVVESADNLSVPDNSIDTVVSTYALCSIPNPSMTLKEIYRVLKPTGRFIFSEHGLAPDASVSIIQNGIDFFYPKIAGGCHVNRNIESLLIENSFKIEKLENIYLPGTQKFLGYNSWGSVST